MYSHPFYITEPVWNNAFSYEQRSNKKLFVPSLKKIQSFDEIELLNPPLHDSSYLPLNKGEFDTVTFEDFGFDDVLHTCSGLKNFYEIDINIKYNTGFSVQAREWHKNPKKLYLFDNHNHAYYFWYLARSQGTLSDNSLLYHIDEHADTRDQWEYLLKPDSWDLQKVFHYTNFCLNVGNYIVPAQREGLIGEVIQIRSEVALREYRENNVVIPAKAGINKIDKVLCRSDRFLLSQEWRDLWEKRTIILNLDLDFFSPGLDDIDYNLKKEVILDIANTADIITVCTSPFFIDQERAVEMFRDVFKQ